MRSGRESGISMAYGRLLNIGPVKESCWLGTGMSVMTGRESRSIVRGYTNGAPCAFHCINLLNQSFTCSRLQQLLHNLFGLTY